MGSTYKDKVLSAWMAVNQVTASLDMTGAAPAFRRAVATTDFHSLIPEWEVDSFRVYVLDSLEGNMVWVDNAQEITVVGRRLWEVLQADYDVVESFVMDMMNGANGVKVISTDSGPYREAGDAWREAHADDLTPAANPLDDLSAKMTALLNRIAAIDKASERSAEQYQQVYVELASITETLTGVRQQVDGLVEMHAMVQSAVATL